MAKGIKILIGIFCVLTGAIIGYVVFQFGVLAGEQNILQTPPPYVSNKDLDKPENIDFAVFWEAWRNLEQYYLNKEKLNPEAMVYGAVRGMVDSLGDSHTNFFDPKETKDFSEELSGKYQGVGMIVGIKNDQLTVVAPLEGTPAQLAGLRAGDKIVKIEETETKDISIEEAVQLIKGPKGSKVRLFIDRKFWEEPKEFLIQRDVIKIPTLEWEIIDNNIALIKIYEFNRILPNEFKQESFKILNSSADRIILDLRNNPGGYLDVAQEIAGWFLDQGELVAKQEKQDEQEEMSYLSHGPSRFADWLIVVLINQGSASASEILAGALRDNRGALLIGQTSFGKGSVQEQTFLSDGSSLKITVGQWLTPNGQSIVEQGLAPDIEVLMTDEDFEQELDPQLDKAIETVKNLD